MKKIILLSLYIFGHISVFSQNKNISISKVPDWVNHIENPDSQIKNNPEGSGFYYQVIDFQGNIDTQNYYSHYVISVTNNEGIQQVSDISIDFDPSFQKLEFHTIKIIRDGNVINKLFKNEIKTAQRETNMERSLYDGTITAFVNLTDVRKGDIIDYSYSTIGSNPVYENKYHSKIYLQHSIPVGYSYNRIKISKTRKLNFKYLNDAKEAAIIDHDDSREYIWETKNTTAVIYDTNTPVWYDPYPNVSISEYNSWKEVVDQYSKHYTLNARDKKELTGKVQKLFSNSPKDSLASNIRKFVQDDIRYLGFEGGLNSHIPNNPLKVLQQRYGDCKAKSFLLSEMYQIFGIEAYPILVHATNGKNIKKELPSPNIFNHCIVQVKKDGENYYIDPTISNQGGNIKNVFVPDYKTGIVLKPGQEKLSDIVSFSENTIRITEKFELEKIGGKGYLYISTKYTGSNADSQRAVFAKKDNEKTLKEYLNFYSALYPRIREYSKIEFIDRRDEKNEILINEAYLIDSLWTKHPDDEQILISEFYPLNLESLVNLNKSPERVMPYYVQYPTDMEHQIVVNLPEDWSIVPENTSVTDSAFNYNYEIAYAYRKLTLTHKYKTLKDHISPLETSVFIAKHEQILNSLSYIITYNKNYITGNTEYSWILILFSIIVFIISCYYGYKIYVTYNLDSTVPSQNSLRIGGWLILVAIGITITPFKVLHDIYKGSFDFYSVNTWNYITKDHSSIQEMVSSFLIIFEITYNTVFVVFSLLVIVLFYTRRTIVPRMMILFYALSFCIPTIDSIIAISVNDTLYSEIDKIQIYKDIGKSLISAAIWIPYFLMSKRVKSTFTEVYST